MKKKFFPFLITVLVFVVALVAQMTIDGVESNAQKISNEKERFTLYENLYNKLTLTTTDKETYDLSKVKDRPVLLNFWASWCLPCMKEFKTLTKFKKKFGDKVLIIGINNDEGEQLKEIAKTQKKMSLNFPVYADVESKVTTDFMISSIPATIVFHKGKVIYFTNEEMDFMEESFIDLIEDSVETE